MFCHKCGTQLPDDAAFCPKCGTKIINENDQARATESPQDKAMEPEGEVYTSDSEEDKSAQESNIALEGAPKKKKTSPLVILSAIIILIVLAKVIFTPVYYSQPGYRSKDTINYMMTVRTWAPYEEITQATCGEVFDKFLLDAEWHTRKSDGEVYVDISGIAKGTDQELKITIQVETKEDFAYMNPVSIEFDGKEQPEDAFYAFPAFFVAYEEEDADLSHIDELFSEVCFAQFGSKLLETYTDEVSGLSFNYPDWWIVKDKSSKHKIVEAYSSRNSENHRVIMNVSITDDPFGVFTGDEASVKKSVNRVHTFLDYGDEMLRDIPAKWLTYQTEGPNDNEEFVLSLYYKVGGEIYCVTFSCPEISSGIYWPIFLEIVESYTITRPQVLLCGVPMEDVMKMSVSEVYQAFGMPEIYSDAFCIQYRPNASNWMDIYFDSYGTVSYISGDATNFTYNGESLYQDVDVIASFLGYDYENLGGTGYGFQCRWFVDECEYRFNFPKFGDSEGRFMAQSVDVYKYGT